MVIARRGRAPAHKVKGAAALKGGKVTNRMLALLHLMASVVCADAALTIRFTNFWLLAIVNALLAAAWLLMPESEEPSDES